MAGEASNPSTYASSGERKRHAARPDPELQDPPTAGQLGQLRKLVLGRNHEGVLVVVDLRPELAVLIGGWVDVVKVHQPLSRPAPCRGI